MRQGLRRCVGRFRARPISRAATRPLAICVGAVFAVSLSSVGASAASPPITLTFGAYASDKPSAMVEQLRPTLDVLEEGAGKLLGRPVRIKLQVARDYATGVANLLSGRFDFERLGAATYVLAKERAPGIEILAAERFGHGKVFDGVICVGKNSRIGTVAQLKGKTFAFGSEESTIGRYMAQLFLARAGITRNDLKSFAYLERHDRVGMAVGSGQFDAGALEGTIFDKLVTDGVPIRALATFQTPTKAWVARVGLDQHIKDALRRALLAIKDPKALAALRFDGFLPANDGDYSLIRAAIKENWRFFRPSSSS
jgi:phosphonate transport system substrate-binding protein